MYEKAVEEDPRMMRYVPNDFKFQGMCEKTVEKYPWSLEYVPDNLKTQGMCNEVAQKIPVVQKIPYLLKYVPDWFVTQQQIKIWHSGLDKWYDGYQRRKAQKAKIKDELLPIAWNPSRWWDWCVPDDEKKETEKLFLTI